MVTIEPMIRVMLPNFSVSDYVPVSTIPELEAYIPNADFLEKAIYEYAEYGKEISANNARYHNFDNRMQLYHYLSEKQIIEIITAIIKKYPVTNNSKRNMLYYLNEPIDIYIPIVPETYRQTLSRQRHYAYAAIRLLPDGVARYNMPDLRKKYGDCFVTKHLLQHKYPYKYAKIIEKEYGLHMPVLNVDKVDLFSFDECKCRYDSGVSFKHVVGKKLIFSGTLAEVVGFAKFHNYKISDAFLNKFFINKCYEKLYYLNQAYLKFV